MLDQLKDFADAHQRDTDMERQKIHNQVYAAAKPFTNPTLAGSIADTVAGGGYVDDSAPDISTTGQHSEQAEQQVHKQENQSDDAKKGDDSTPKNVNWDDL
jgi:hypothetical protein